MSTIKNLKEETVDLLLLEMEDLHRQSEANMWERYNPLPHQALFHKSQAQIRAFIGGNRSGKTTAGVMEVVRYALGRHPFREIPTPNHGWIVGLDREVLKDVVLPTLFKYLPADKIKSYNRIDGIITLTNNSTIKIKSCESGATKFQSAECLYIWFDEEPPKDIWDESSVRTGRDRLEIWITMTPLRGMDWTFDELYKQNGNGDVECFVGHTKDNTHLQEKERERLIRKFTGTDDESARLRGEYFHRSGLVYKNFRRDVHAIDPFKPPAYWPMVVAVDPHTRKPSVALFALVSPENVMYIIQEVIAKPDTLIKEFAGQIKAVEAENRIFRRLIDPSSMAVDTARTGTSLRDELGREGVPTALANNDRFFGIEEVRSRLEKKTLFIFRTCVRTVWEMEHYVWEDWKFRKTERDLKEEPRKKDDDLVDCLRYLCASRVQYEKDEQDTGYLPEHQVSKYTGY